MGLRVLVFAAVCCFGRAAVARPLVDIAPGSDYGNALNEPHFNGTWGWTFFVKSPIVATHVAWYDESGDGLSHSHLIGLWKDLSGATTWPFFDAAQSEQLLQVKPFPEGEYVIEGAVVPAGTVAELVSGWWRQVPLPGGPITLAPGGYAIGGVDNANSTDAIRYQLDYGAITPFADSRIVIGSPGYSTTAGFKAPSRFFLVSGVELGPMLFVQPVPEPSTSVIILAALSFLPAVRRAEARMSQGTPIHRR